MMSASFAAGCLWLIAANVTGMFPSRRKHWPQAYVLIALGLPILIWIALSDGIWIAALALAMAASVLRWPLVFLFRRVVRLARGAPAR